MSQENVEIVRAILDALNDGDAAGAFKYTAPGFEYDFSRSIGLQRGVSTGAEARRFWKEFASAWESSRWEVDEFIEADEHVVTPLTLSVRRRNGIEVQALSTAWMWTFRGGMVARISFYTERQEALEAVGLRGVGRSPRTTP
jgi:ketosteroid isomerase-like protein